LTTIHDAPHGIGRWSMRKAIFPLILSAIFTVSCAGFLSININRDPHIKSLRAYDEIKISKWKETGIQVAEGETILITPLYPKGFLYPIKGKVGGSDYFSALDVDSEEIYQAKTSGFLGVGSEKKYDKPIQVGIFIFKSVQLNAIIEDLTYIQSKYKSHPFTNLTMALLLKKKGESAAMNGQYPEALEDMDRAISSFQTVDPRIYSTTISRLYKLKAGIYKFQGDQNQFSKSVNESMEALMAASEYYGLTKGSRFAFLRLLTSEERVILLNKTNYFKVLTSTDWGGDLDSLTDAYRFIARYYTESGDLAQSLRYSEKAIQEAQKNGMQKKLWWGYRDLTFRHQYFQFWALGEQAALMAAKYCVQPRQCLDTRISTAYSRINTGRIKTISELQKYIGYDSIPQDWLPLRLRVDLMKAQLYTNVLNDYKSAIQILQEVLEHQAKLVLQDHGLYVYGMGALINSYIKTGRFHGAEQLINKAEAELENLENPGLWKLRISLLKVRLMRQMGKDPSEALNEAIALLEEIRPTSGSNADYSFWEDRLSIYNGIVDVLYRKGDYAQALEMAEKARSRRFLDYLGNKKMGVKTASSYLLFQQADAILETLINIENDMVNAAQAAGIKVRTVYQEGTRYTQQLERHRSKLKAIAKSDQQFGIAHNISPLSPREIQKRLPPDVTVLEYYLTDSALYTWVLDQKNINLVKQDIFEKELRDLVVAFRGFTGTDAPKRDLTITRKVSKEAGDTGEKLYARLISPVQKYITTQKVCIVPYGILNYLPFQALHDGEKYLVERYAISYVPSLSVLEFLGKGGKKEQYKVLAFGNPDLKDKALDLPAAEKEVMEISSIYPDAQVFKREKATKGLLKKLISQYDIIHFACHGQYVPEAPLTSCIRLAPENEEDGRLEANEIFDMNMKADLIVTSACQTAIGQIGKGDEVVGLTRAFLYAGARSVLGSLWSISDEATAVFMKEFYSNLKKMDKAEALRQAQVKMIQSKEYSNLFYWAAFNLTGSF